MENEFQYLDVLLDQLTDPDATIKINDLTSLSDLDDDRLADLRAKWGEIEPSRRTWLTQQLVELSEDDATLDFNALFLFALGDESSEARIAAVQGLWEYTGRDLEQHLKNILVSDPEYLVRGHASAALGRYVLQNEFNNASGEEQDDLLRTLRDTVNDEEEVITVRAAALETIGYSSKDWVKDEIRKAYEDEDDSLRLSAVHAMGNSCDSGWLPIVYRELASSEAEMRFEAVSASGAIGEDETVPHLKPLLDDEDSEVRAATISALGEIGGSEAKALLLQRLHNADEPLKELIEEALGETDFTNDPLAFRFRL